jgi:transposase
MARESENLYLLLSKSEKAITSLLNNEKGFCNYMIDGQPVLVNSKAARVVKPFVIGRKNFLFCKSRLGGAVIASMCRIVESENSIVNSNVI